MRTWQASEARARMKDLFDEAVEHGPQRIERRGKPAIVVVSQDEWERRASAEPRFADLLASCPIDDEDLPPQTVSRAVRDGWFD